jgi:hypothetical protein
MRRGPSRIARPLLRSMLPYQRRIRLTVLATNRSGSGSSSKPEACTSGT